MDTLRTKSATRDVGRTLTGITQDPRSKLKPPGREKSKAKRQEGFMKKRQQILQKGKVEQQKKESEVEVIMNMGTRQVRQSVIKEWKQFMMTTRNRTDDQNYQTAIIIKEVDEALESWSPESTRFSDFTADKGFKMNLGLTLLITSLFKKLNSGGTAVKVLDKQLEFKKMKEFEKGKVKEFEKELLMLRSKVKEMSTQEGKIREKQVEIIKKFQNGKPIERMRVKDVVFHDIWKYQNGVVLIRGQDEVQKITAECKWVKKGYKWVPLYTIKYKGRRMKLYEFYKENKGKGLIEGREELKSAMKEYLNQKSNKRPTRKGESGKELDERDRQ